MAAISGRIIVTRDFDGRLRRPLRVGDQNDVAAPRRHLLHIRHGLFENAIIRGDHHDRHVLVDQCDRPMLQFARGITFRMDVGNFLEFERSLQRERDSSCRVRDTRRRWIWRSRARASSICGSVVSASDIGRGISISPCTSSASSSSDNSPRALPAAIASAASTINWQVKALVEATPISGPASVCSTVSLSRAIVDVVTLTTESVCRPCCFA